MLEPSRLERPRQAAAQAPGRSPEPAPEIPYAETREAAERQKRVPGLAKRFEKVENATAVIWNTLLIAEKTFRRLDAPELLADVASDVVYVNGARAVNRGEKKAAA